VNTDASRQRWIGIAPPCPRSAAGKHGVAYSSQPCFARHGAAIFASSCYSRCRGSGACWQRPATGLRTLRWCVWLGTLDIGSVLACSLTPTSQFKSGGHAVESRVHVLLFHGQTLSRLPASASNSIVKARSQASQHLAATATPSPASSHHGSQRHPRAS